MAKPPRNGTDSKGRAVYDLSGDEEAARRGDEDAASRLRTQRYISTRSQRLLTAT